MLKCLWQWLKSREEFAHSKAKDERVNGSDYEGKSVAFAVLLLSSLHLTIKSVNQEECFKDLEGKTLASFLFFATPTHTFFFSSIPAQLIGSFVVW